MGKFGPVVIGLLAGLAEVERSLIRERTLESVQHRRETGVILPGSHRGSSSPKPRRTPGDAAWRRRSPLLQQ